MSIKLKNLRDQVIERGEYPGHVAKTSLYTRASLHPLLIGAALVGAALALATLWNGGRREPRTHHDGNHFTTARNRTTQQVNNENWPGGA